MPDNLSKPLLKIQTDMESFIRDHLLDLDNESYEAKRGKVIAASKNAGFYFKTQSLDFGGDPATCLELLMLREQLAASNSDLRKYVFGPGPGVLHAASDELKVKYLDPLLAGEKRMAFAFTEPVDAKKPTYGILKGEEIEITGRKSYITNGAAADFISVLVNLQNTENKKLGTIMVIVDKERAGVTIEQAFTSMDGGEHLAMCFTSVKVPLCNMIGKPGEGMPRALKSIADIRLMVAAEAMGTCIWLLSFLEEKLKAPHRSGQALAEKENIRLQYADMRIKVYMARAMLYRTARIVDSGENAVNEISACKVITTELVGDLVDRAIQLVGGQALVVGHPLEKLYREVRSLKLVEGANDLLRLNIAKGRLDLKLGRL